jgi:hypothetical protein
MSLSPAGALRRGPRRSRALTGVAAALPLIVLAGLLVLPGAASAGELFDPDLVVSISDSPGTVAPGGTVTFTVLVTNTGNEDSTNTSALFFSPEADVESVGSSQGECSIVEGKGSQYVDCQLGTIQAPFSSAAAPTPAGVASNQAQITVVTTAPSESGSFTSDAQAFPGGEGETDQNLADNQDSETTFVESGDSDSGTIPPGGSLSTVNGTQGNPVNQGDPFALTLKNSSNQALDASIAEEPCNGTQSGPLCSTPRLGGVLGNFQFQPAAGLRVLGASGPVVTIGKLYYDRTLVNQTRGVRIFYQKNPGAPVVRLPRCNPLETECFRVKNLASGDQVIRVAFSSDPRVTRG